MRDVHEVSERAFASATRLALPSSHNDAERPGASTSTEKEGRKRLRCGWDEDGAGSPLNVVRDRAATTSSRRLARAAAPNEERRSSSERGEEPISPCSTRRRLRPRMPRR